MLAVKLLHYEQVMKWIGLLDCNNFFVSCERLFRPDLAGKPVVVLSSNDGCIVARSQEVKDMGIPMGVPYFQVKDTLKKADTAVFSSHFALYRDISRRVFEVMRQELDTVQQYSVDEAFFALSETNPEPLLERLVSRVQRDVGIPVSVGLATTKTLAKYANSVAKKSGQVYILEPDEWSKQQPTVALKDIWGVGGQLELRYKKHDLNTVADLLRADPSRIARLFGVAGTRLCSELAGTSVYSLETVRSVQKSILSSRSFRAASTEYAVVADAVAYHIRHAAADLRSMQLQASRLRVFIYPSRHGDFMLQGGTAEIVLDEPTDDTLTLVVQADRLLQRIFNTGVPYKKAGVQLGGFVPKNLRQASLFAENTALDTDTNTGGAALTQVLDTVNARAGKEVLSVGGYLRSGEWGVRLDARSPAYTTRWSDIAVAAA